MRERGLKYISRLEALKIETQQELEKLYGNITDSIDKHIVNTYVNDFYHTACEAQEYAKHFCNDGFIARTFKGKNDYKDISLENANASKTEYLAESFLAYMKGERDILDPEYVKYMDKHFKKQPFENVAKSSTIKVNKIISGHSSTPKQSESNSIIDHVDEDGTVDARGFYGNNGMKQKDIHTNNHGNPKWHDYGKHGEHSHDYEWDKDGGLKKDYERINRR